MAHSDPSPWLIAESESDGLPLIYRIRESAPIGVSRHQYPNLLSLLWRYDPEPSGMPSEEDDDLMNDFEDRLEALEERSFGFLTAVVTGNNEKEWFIYVSDLDSFMSEFQGALTGLPRLPLEIEHSSDPEWTSYDAFISAVRPE